MQRIATAGAGLATNGDPVRNAEGRPIVNLAELPGILWRRHRWIYGTALPAIAAAFAYGMLAPPTYVAGARLLIDPRGLQIVEREIAPRGPSSEINLAVVESQMRVLSSDNVYKRVIENLKLLDDPEFTGKRGIIALIKDRLPRFKERTENEPMVEVLSAFRKAVKAERLQNSFIVDIYVSSEGREKSARIANEIAAVYTSSETSNREGQTVRASDSLASRLTELKNKLRMAEEVVERYKRQNSIVVTGATTGSIAIGTAGGGTTGGNSGSLFSDQELAQLNQQLAQVRTLATQAQARAEQIERVLRSGASPDSIAEAIQSQTIAQLRVRHSIAQQQAASLAVDLLPGHPSMVAARARVTDATTQIRGELDRIARAARADLERARASERELTAGLERAKRQRGTTDQARVQLRELERDADANRAIYESFLVRARELGEQKSVDTTNARVISPALTPAEPKGLRLSMLLPLALFAGLGLGCILALSCEQLDPVVRTASHIEKAVGLPVIAEIPHVRGRRLRSDLPDLVTGPASTPTGDAMRRLRASLGSTGQSGGPRLVLVTGIDGAGTKSLVAFNLALAAGAGGESVLLIDGDTVRHHLSSAHMNVAQAGLADVMHDKTRLEDAMVSDDTGLIRMLAAIRPGQSNGRTTEPAIRRLLEEKCENFDLVVVDGGLIGQDNVTNIFATIVDDIVPVAGSGATRKAEIASALAKLGPLAGKVRGIALVAA